MIGQFCSPQARNPQVLLPVDIGIAGAQVFQKLLIDCRISALDLPKCFFDMHHHGFFIELLPDGIRNHPAVLTEQSAEKTQLMEIAEALRNSTAFSTDIILLAVPVLLAPSPVHFQAVLEIGIG